MKTQSLATVRANFSEVVNDVATTQEQVTITKNGEPVAVLISIDDLESMKETLFWAGQPVEDDEDGETVSLDLIKAELATRSALDVVNAAATAAAARKAQPRR